MTFGLIDVSYSLPEGQALKLTFFAPWGHMILQVLQFFFATLSPKEMRKKKQPLNSFARVLVSLVYWWHWVGLVGLVGILRRVVFCMQPLLPLLAVTCSLKKSRSACPMECSNTCLRDISPSLHAVAKMAKNWRNRSLH